MCTVSQIQQVTKGKFVSKADETAAVQYLLIDSRKLLYPSTTLFFAIKTATRTGAGFVQELYEKGVRNFIVSANDTIPSIPNANVIAVDDVVLALQQLAAYHRSQFTIPVVGITGSNGKTIVKEWLFQLLHQDLVIVRSPKSYNSQIGVPLSVWEMDVQHQLGIFEAGISTLGEMENLERVIQPTVGIFTTIGNAHAEGFSSQEEKILEKCKLFANAKVLIYNSNIFLGNNISIEDLKTVLHKQVELYSWSFTDDSAVLFVDKVVQKESKTLLEAKFYGQRKVLSIPFTDNASVENAITCWLYLLYQQMPDSVIAERMQLLKPVAMRLELKQGVNNCSIVNDSYSADINSLVIALDFLLQQKQHKKRTIVISDFLQSGVSAEELYSSIAAIIEQKKIDRVIAIGEEISIYKALFNGVSEVNFYASTHSFLQQYHPDLFSNETILLKGARKFEFEKIAKLLESQSHQTVLEINLNALSNNLKVYQNQLNAGTKLMAMVKAFGYGSGGFEIANLLQFQKVDYLAVAFTDEGVELRKGGITLPIMVMNAEPYTYELLLQYQLQPEIFSFNSLQNFTRFLEDNDVANFPIHIKIDTGMRRLGFELGEIDELGRMLKANDRVKVQSVFSHLASSDNQVDDEFTLQQGRVFKAACDILETNIGYSFIRHIANTAAISRHKQLQFDMVRLGIGLYGVDGQPQIQQQLKTVSTLKTTIAQIKKVKQGESVGYNRSGIAEHDITIATVRIGYADGYPRALSNGVGKMVLHGKLVPVIGIVCMDMVMLDITGIAAKEGDEVIVFGEPLSVTQVAKWSGTIAYEILTGISHRVKRIYYEE